MGVGEMVRIALREGEEGDEFVEERGIAEVAADKELSVYLVKFFEGGG